MSNLDLEIVPVPTNLPDKISTAEIMRIGNFLMDGLAEDEACVLAGYPPAQLKILKQTFETVANYLEQKKIEFKHKHLKSVNSKRSDKNSMWLLENLRPEEFGAKKKVGDTTVNVFGSIIKAIREANDTIPVNIQDAEYILNGQTSPKREQLDPQKILN